MITKGNLSREQATAIVGARAIAEVEAANCDFTNRLMPPGDNRVEFAASVGAADADGVACTVVAYYYQTGQDVEKAGDDLSSIAWAIHGYEVV